MKLKRTSRRLVRRIALGLAIVAVAAPSAGAMYGLPMTGYNDNAVKNAALAHAYNVWKQNGATDTTRLAYLLSSASGQNKVVPPGWNAGGPRTFDVGAEPQDVSGILRKYDMIPHHALDESGPISRPAPADAYLDKGGMLIPADLSGRQFGPAALPSATASTPVTAPESRFGPGRVLPVASPGEEFTWDDATIGIVAGLGTALIAAMIGFALMSRRDRFARA